MARRSDHSRPELEALILAEGHRLMAEVGPAGFSAREVAKRIGYSVGTIYNVYGNLDRLLLAINRRSFDLWTELVRKRLARRRGDRIAALVESYFEFALGSPNLWTAIYERHAPQDEPLPPDYVASRAALTGLVEAEIARVLPQSQAAMVPALTRSLLATVHGHCVFALNGTFPLLGETDPQAAALARVRESLAAAGG